MSRDVGLAVRIVVGWVSWFLGVLDLSVLLRWVMDFLTMMNGLLGFDSYIQHRFAGFWAGYVVVAEPFEFDQVPGRLVAGSERLEIPHCSVQVCDDHYSMS